MQREVWKGGQRTVILSFFLCAFLAGFLNIHEHLFLSSKKSYFHSENIGGDLYLTGRKGHKVLG